MAYRNSAITGQTITGQTITRLAIMALAITALAAVAPTTPAGASDDLKAQITEGKELYDAYCVTCHGPNLVNKGTRAYDLRKFPLADQPRFTKSVNDGKKAMPAWKDILQPAEVDMIWQYVKTRGRT